MADNIYRNNNKPIVVIITNNKVNQWHRHLKAQKINNKTMITGTAKTKTKTKTKMRAYM